MPSSSPNYGLTLHSTSDTGVNFLAYRLAQNSPDASSNMMKLDTALGGINTRVVNLEALKNNIPISATSSGGSTYVATSSFITSYVDGLSIALQLQDIPNSGTAVLNINSLGNKNLEKYNSSGALVNLDANDLRVGKVYIFRYYSGSGVWLWVQGNSGDQLNVVGTTGNVTSITADNTLGDSGIASVDISNALIAFQTGWIPSTLTWTYASATTFTVPGDVTINFPVGSKIKLTQTTTKYFIVVSATYSSPNTTVTITGGTTYTLANAAITNPYYSYIATPQAFPQWFSWTPTWTSLTTTGSPSYVGYFTVIGRLLSFGVQINSNGGTTACNYGTNYINNLPITVAGVRGSDMTYNMDSGSFMGGAQHVATTKYLYPPTWAATGSTILINGSYQI